jgi:hypothetical protein
MPAFRSASNGAYSAKVNTTVNAPAGIVDGDVLIFFLFIAISGTPPTPTPPAGFTALAGFPSAQFGLSGFNARVYAWWKIAASESGSYTATHSSASSQGSMLAVSGAHQTAPIDPNPTVNTGTGTTTTALGLTTDKDGDLLIFIGTDWGTTANNLTPPSGSTPTFTERQDVALTYIATGNLATAGATGNKTITNNSSATDPWSGSLIAVTGPDPAATATLSGTALNNITESDIVAGGKTIVITLSGDTFIT